MGTQDLLISREVWVDGDRTAVWIGVWSQLLVSLVCWPLEGGSGWDRSRLGWMGQGGLLMEAGSCPG